MINCEFTNDELWEQFLKEKRFLNNCADKTIKTYAAGWSAFKRYGPSEISANGAKQFMIAMSASGMKSGASNSFSRSLNSFFSWLLENQYISERIKMALRPVPKTVLSTFSPEDLKVVLSSKPRKDSHKTLIVLLTVLCDVGLRVDESLELNRSDIDFDNFLITVRKGKGGKQRVVPFSPACRAVLYRFLQTHKFERVFCTATGGKLSYNNLRRSFIELCEWCGVTPGDGCFHQLRRFYARSLSRSGVSVIYLSALLGHSSVAVTARYIETSEEDLRRIHAAHSPLERLKRYDGMRPNFRRNQ